MLLTDAWPGVFDERVITAIRTVQEAVERILSGQDVRYYPPSPESARSEQTHLTAPTTWPDTPAGGTLGDGRNALATFRPTSVEASMPDCARSGAKGLRFIPKGDAPHSIMAGPPRRPGVAIDTTGISQLIDYPFADMTITVEAGLTLAGLRRVLAEQNQRVLVDAPRADRATLGGIYATNTSGPRRFSAGRPRDQIIGVSFVTSDGVVVKGGGRVVKNVAGYDFPKLLTGSMGTLGIITQMTLKVRPIPEARRTRLGPVLEPQDPGRFARSAQHVRDAAGGPRALEQLRRTSRGPGAGLADRTGHHRHRLSKTMRRRCDGSSTSSRPSWGATISRSSRAPTRRRSGTH